MSTKRQEHSLSPRVARRRARARERILTAAARLFSTHGIDGVTLADVADEADVSRGNLYSHFGGKQELLHFICQPMFTYAAEQFQRLSSWPPAQAIEGIVRIHWTIWQEFPGALSVAHQLQDTSMGDSAHTAHLQDAMRIFQQAAGENLLRVEPALAIKMFNAVAVPLLELCQEAPDPDELFVESMLRLLLRE
jgi:AcrR family transcriptional regulator